MKGTGLVPQRRLSHDPAIATIILPVRWREDSRTRDLLDWDMAPQDNMRSSECEIVWGVDLNKEQNFHPLPLGNNRAQAYVARKERELLDAAGADVLVIRNHDLVRRDLWLCAPGVGQKREGTQQPHVDCAPYRYEHYGYQALHCMSTDEPGSAETAYLPVHAGLELYADLIDRLAAGLPGSGIDFSYEDLQMRLQAAKADPGPRSLTEQLVYLGIIPILTAAIERKVEIPGLEDSMTLSDCWRRLYQRLGDQVSYIDWQPNQTVICRQDAKGYMHGRFTRLGGDAEGVFREGRLLIHIS